MQSLNILLGRIVILNGGVLNLSRDIRHHGIYNLLNAITIDVDEYGD